ncbi:MAG TPA: lipid A biosynthesis acyltransferase [Burkholderiales bacterium]|nr:lipid A biosynthesis acyltransferase [Burkholderiales bacterium]
MSRVAFALMWLLHFLPLRAIAAAGNALGNVLFWLIPERRRVTRINLEKCFPQMDRRERETLARAHFRALCRSFLDLALVWWAPRERIRRLVRIEGLGHLRGLGGAPAILFVPHFVGLDIGGSCLAGEVRLVSMYSRHKDPHLAERLIRGRGRLGDHKLISRQQGVRAAIAGMREGRALYYLPDQDYGPRGALFTPFFGVPAATMPGLSRIARLVGARVLPCVTRMLPGGAGYVLTIEPPWENFPTEDLAADTRRMNEYIERKALEMPEQYLWMHKRFKTRPAGEPRFY